MDTMRPDILDGVPRDPRTGEIRFSTADDRFSEPLPDGCFYQSVAAADAESARVRSLLKVTKWTEEMVAVVKAATVQSLPPASAPAR